MHYIEVENLTFYYDDEPVLEDVSYYVDPGEFVILTGENGAAKSTLIKSTLGLLKPTSGKITVAKKNSAGEKISIGYIPQQVASFNAGFPSTVIDEKRSSSCGKSFEISGHVGNAPQTNWRAFWRAKATN